MRKTLIMHGVVIVVLAVIIWWAVAGVDPAAVDGSLSVEGVSESGREDGLKAQVMAMIKGVVAFALVGIYGAFLTFKYVLPKFSGAVSDFMYSDSSAPEVEEHDAMRTARIFYAQGEYEGAAEAYAQAAIEQPEERLPVVERAKIQLEHLDDAQGAVATYREALDGREWELEDGAFLMFRLIDLYQETLEDVDAAKGVLEEVVEKYPETRHSANAAHKLRKLA